MQNQSATKAYAKGLFYGREISFKRTFYDHYITDEEVTGLLEGYVIEIKCTLPNEHEERKVRIRLQQRQGEHGKYIGIISELKKGEFKENYNEKDINWSEV